MMRRTQLTRSLIQGAGVLQLKQISKHKSLSALQGYVDELNQADTRKVVDTFVKPVGETKPQPTEPHPTSQTPPQDIMVAQPSEQRQVTELDKLLEYEKLKAQNLERQLQLQQTKHGGMDTFYG